jgi:hypothetical protein
MILLIRKKVWTFRHTTKFEAQIEEIIIKLIIFLSRVIYLFVVFHGLPQINFKK